MIFSANHDRDVVFKQGAKKGVRICYETMVNDERAEVFDGRLPDLLPVFAYNHLTGSEGKARRTA